jgi:18S rRNA (adenine1779-N6/adenine1780-N6)-dimethyltransferase
LTFKLLATTPAPRVCVLMFQREFALRVVARPGDPLYCRLSVNAQMWARCTHIMKVGKNNFKPPPKVESSVIKIEPKVPRPPVSYDEWDGLLRIVFVRGNKTIRASFGTRAVLELVERNWRTWGALEGMDLDAEEEVEVEVEEEDGVGMEVDEEGRDVAVEQKRGKKKVRSKGLETVKRKIEKVLEETEMGDKRPTKCDEADFLKLLYAFNQEGIHFS